MRHSLHYIQQLAGAEVFYDERRQNLTSQPELLSVDDLGPRTELYATALRGLAHIQHDRRLGRWEGDPEEEFRARLRPEIRKLAILNNVEAYHDAYSAGDVGGDLLPHQHVPFRNMLTYLRREAFKDPGHIAIPTAFGKSFLSIKALEAMGSGAPVSEHDPAPIRALYLVPRELLVHQIIGEDGKKGFGRFAPSINVTPYYGKEKDLSGDVVVMLYRSYVMAEGEGILDDEQFDVKIYDEGHHTLGLKTSRAITKARERTSSIELAMTASPAYNEQKAVNKLFPVEVAKVELVDAINNGSLASVQCWLYETDSVIQVNNSTRSKDYTEAELLPLRYDAKRNNRAVDFIAQFVESGRQGLARCVPGDKSAHAKEIAELANRREITDPESGLKRKLRASAIGTFQTDREQQDVQARFDRGDLDVLCYVSILDEGWDSPRAKFFVRLAPTRSRVVAPQSLGRILRRYKPQPLAQVVEFLDIIVGRRLPVMFAQTLAQPKPEQGMIVGPNKDQEKQKGEPIERNRRPLSIEDFADEIAARLARTDYKLVQELLVEPLPIPDGWLAIDTLLAYSGLKSYTGIYRYLEENGMPPTIGGTGRRYYPPEAKELIRADIIERIAPEDYTPAFSLPDELGMTKERLRALIDELKIDAVTYRDVETLRERPHIREDDVVRLRKHLEVAERRISFEDLAAEIGISPATLAKRIPVDMEPMWQRSTVTGIKQRYITLDQAEILKKSMIPPEGSKTVHDLAAEWGISLNKVKRAVSEDDGKAAKFAMHAVSRRMHLHYPPEIIEQIRSRCAAPRTMVSIAMIADIFDCSVDEVARRIPKEILETGTRWKPHLSSDVTDVFFDSSHLVAIGRALRISYATKCENLAPVDALAFELKVSSNSIEMYYPSGQHIRRLPDDDNNSRLFVLPGPLREIKKFPPAREGWLSEETIMKAVTGNVSEVTRARIQDYLRSRTGSDIAIMKPYEGKTAPVKHFSPHVVVVIGSLVRP